MTNPSDPAARRNLIQRIDRYLFGLARARRQPNRRESYHVRDALEHLKAGRPADGEEAMVKAERAAPLPPHVASLIETNHQVTLEELRGELQRMTSGGPG
jgi:hypothetical protein